MASIIRANDNPADNFVMIYNATARDNTLTLKARGLLTYLLSQAPGYHTSAEKLAQVMLEGVAAILTGMAELERAGYLRRERHSVNGTWVHDIFIYSRPQPPEEAYPDNRGMPASGDFAGMQNRGITTEDEVPKKTKIAVGGGSHQGSGAAKPTPQTPPNYDEHGPLSPQCDKHAGSLDDIPCWDCAAVKPEFQAAQTRRAAVAEKFRQAQLRVKREREAGSAPRPADFWARVRS